MQSAMRRGPPLGRSSATTRTRTLASSSNAAAESFLSGNSAPYAEEMYRAWRTNPASVHGSWATYFSSLEHGTPNFQAPPSSAYNPSAQALSNLLSGGGGVVASRSAPATHAGNATSTEKQIALNHLMRAYQTTGHKRANLDPLGIKPPASVFELEPATYGFTEADLDVVHDVPGFTGIVGFMGGQTPRQSLRELISQMESAYCGSVGVEYMHIGSREKCNFIRERFEVVNYKNGLSNEERLTVLDRLHYAEMFEAFLGKRFNTAKRFGLEGCEAVIPGFKMFIDRASELGGENFVIGMPHRGRLNVLVNVMRKPLELVFSEFHGTNVDAQKFYDSMIQGYSQSGDVKYHLGTSYRRTYPDGRTVKLSLLANPSHLEAVDPVVQGKTRAKQHFSKDVNREKSIPVLMHGDAAFCGQGVVYETLTMAKLPHYETGGTIHIIVNNQLGFTTDPEDSRSTRYASDLGRAFDCPVFHVNADDPEAVAYVFKVAAEWRQTYKEDVILDVIGYRRYGHNETDEAPFTQPTMYNVIKKHPTVLTKHREDAVSSGLVNQESCDAIQTEAKDTLTSAFTKSQEGISAKDHKEDWLDSRWQGFKSTRQLARIKPTGVPLEKLREIGEKIYKAPKGFNLHRTLKRLLKAKNDMMETGKNLDWAAAEHLAFGSLCLENNHVRLSGQDVQRGTFSHRHAVWHDQETNETYTPLQHLSDSQAEFHACNSPLSEMGVLGYELGYSLENPNSLVMWEAQFGDFSNGAQVIIDQFISCGESKWLRQSGLVMLLPHGYDGQGPEHSSCRIERYLQLSDEDPDHVPNMAADERMQIQESNWQVVNCTTPAQIFHVLRRQVHREFRKPLIVVSPKMLLRYKGATSDLEDFGPNSSFKRLIPEVDDRVVANEKVRKLVFCVGKVYYHLAEERERKELWDVAIVRIEQISPFPFDKVAEVVKRYPNAKMIYCQEEPKNMACWKFVDDLIFTSTRVLLGDGRRCEYVGRKTMASPAVGYGSVHEREQAAIVSRALE